MAPSSTSSSDMSAVSSPRLGSSAGGSSTSSLHEDEGRRPTNRDPPAEPEQEAHVANEEETLRERATRERLDLTTKVSGLETMMAEMLVSMKSLQDNMDKGKAPPEPSDSRASRGSANSRRSGDDAGKKPSRRHYSAEPSMSLLDNFNADDHRRTKAVQLTTFPCPVT